MRRISSLAFAGVLLFILVLGAISARAAEAARKFEITSGPAEIALKTFSEQAGRSVVFASDKVKNIRTNPVQGQLPPSAALEQLIAGTGLIAVADRKTAGFSIRRETEVEAKNVSRATAETSARPDRSNHEAEAGEPEMVVKLDTFEVFGRKTLNMDVKRTTDDPLAFHVFNFERIQSSGATSIEEFLKQELTMNTTVQMNSQAQPSIQRSATSSINLRGLGTNQTLILVDGRRRAGVSIGLLSTGATSQPDINGIPLSAVERIEVLPSSASAIYGGVAAGGVVNIILKRSYSGGELTYRREQPESSDSYTENVSFTYGLAFNGGKTHISLSAQASENKPMLLRDRREMVERNIATILRNSPNSFLFYNNTSSPFPGATPNIASSSSLVLKNGTPLNSTRTFVPAGTRPGDDIRNALTANAGSYNIKLSETGAGTYGLGSPFGTATKRDSLMGTIRHAVSENYEVFGEFSTNTNRGSAKVNPQSFGVAVPASAPTNPFLQSVRVTFPSSYGANIKTSSRNQTIAGGVIAKLPGEWQAEFDYTWSRNNYKAANVALDPAFATAISSGLLNPFVDTIQFPVALEPYVASSNFSGSATLHDIGVRAGGPTLSLPGGPLMLNVGAGYRKEGNGEATSKVDYPYTPASNNHRIMFPQSTVTESVFSELRFPFVKSGVIRGVHQLDLHASGRFERYHGNIGTSYVFLSPPSLAALSPPQGIVRPVRYESANYNLALKYSPIDSLALRVSYGTAFLPPTVPQLLPNPVETQPIGQSFIDPKTGTSYGGWVYSSGGNPNLRPQTSETIDYGIIWQPKGMFKGLRVNAQWFDITQPDYITTPSIQQLVSNPEFTNHVIRDPNTGLVTKVNIMPVNATKYQTTGFDVNASYTRRMRIAEIRARFGGTWIRHDYRQNSIGAPSIDHAGYPADGGAAKVKLSSGIECERGRWTLGWYSTFVSSYLQIGAPNSPTVLRNGPTSFYTSVQGGDRIPSQHYHDMLLTYRYPRNLETRAELLSGITVQFGIKNIFNKIPPFDASYGPYYYSPYGDPKLRTFWASVKKEF